MIINNKIKHTKFGNCTIVDFNVNPVDELLSTVTAKFDDENVGEKKFCIDYLDKFFTGVDDETLNYISDLRKEKALKLEKEHAFKEIERKIIPVHNKDEYDEDVSVDAWYKAYKVAGDYRFRYESRAIVMDDAKLFINAAAGLKYIESDPKSGNKLYAACEKRSGRYLGHKWKYATKDEIKDNCLEGVEIC